MKKNDTKASDMVSEFNHHRKQNDIVMDLMKSIVLLQNSDDAYAFFKDLCTPQELRAMAERWIVCQLLAEKKMSYREISDETGVSLATITRVARFFKDEAYGGYRMMLYETKKHS